MLCFQPITFQFHYLLGLDLKICCRTSFSTDVGFLEEKVQKVRGEGAGQCKTS